MKRFYIGNILLDGIDSISISFFISSIIAYSFRRYQNYRKIKTRGKDQILDELKRESPINMVSKKG
jgi:hypothetical protein